MVDSRATFPRLTTVDVVPQGDGSRDGGAGGRESAFVGALIGGPRRLEYVADGDGLEIGDLICEQF